MPRRNDLPKITVDWDAVDWDSVDEAALALLLLGVHDGYRTWKGFSWDVMNRLHDKGFISDPKSKAKSVVFTEEGFTASQELFTKLFCKPTERPMVLRVG
jgi:hypothetical protein